MTARLEKNDSRSYISIRYIRVDALAKQYEIDAEDAKALAIVDL